MSRLLSFLFLRFHPLLAPLACHLVSSLDFLTLSGDVQHLHLHLPRLTASLGMEPTSVGLS